jgi:SAM-dependent methyltransferase
VTSLHNKVKPFWISRAKRLLAKGKISWLEPGRIEGQSIVDSLVEAKGYAKGRLLDVGCGQKPYKSLFSHTVNEHIGIELPLLESANKREDRDMDVYGDALNLPFKSNCFDTILSTQVLEHVVEPKQMLREAYRVLREGGYIILTAPMVGELHEVPNDYYRYTIYGLRYLAESVGFEIISIKARSGFWGVIGQGLSSYVYNWKGKPKYLVEQAIKRSLATAVQAFYGFLDKIDRKETQTLGYTMIAKK